MDRHLIVGLGNPGPRYAGNRHNVGFMVLDRVAADAGIDVTRSKFKGTYGTGHVEGCPVALLKPETFMNLSGQAVSGARSFFGVDVSRILVIHDEIDLPFGVIRLKVGGGHAGHNGLRSIVAELGSRDFLRLRVGVGRPKRGDVAAYVLQDFDPKDEQPWLGDLVARGAEAVHLTLKEGAQRAMNTVNASG